MHERGYIIMLNTGVSGNYESNKVFFLLSLKVVSFLDIVGFVFTLRLMFKSGRILNEHIPSDWLN